MTVIVDEGQIRRVYRRVDATPGLRFVPDDGAPAIVDRIDMAVSHIRFEFLPDQPIHGVETGFGISFFDLRHVRPKELLEVARSIAAALEWIGLSGTVTAHSEAHLFRNRRQRQAANLAFCCVNAALDFTIQGVAAPWATAPQHWNRESTEFVELTQRVTDWIFSISVGDVYAGPALAMSECLASHLPGIISRCCADGGGCRIEFDADDYRYEMAFTDEGWVQLLQLQNPGEKPNIAVLLDRMRRWSDLIDTAFVSRSGIGSGQVASVAGAYSSDFLLSPINLQADHEILKTTALDIFPIQLLGPGHPPLQPAERWDVEDLGEGKAIYTLTPQTLLPHMQPPHDLLVPLREANGALVARWHPPPSPWAAE
ncbi:MULTISPECIES: hypothetical protein [Arthrobacter]|uniref:Uncharacterized protein n=2 Tax=Arthrobacter TaxID=1663 RepID=A0ABU9KMT9_9MICC|nr:hypothetical protein [Arthrobacter sp. YJM1]MDP5227658.1 hypothetical protein [Arthrobacter sp. YJM1]